MPLSQVEVWSCVILNPHSLEPDDFSLGRLARTCGLFVPIT